METQKPVSLKGSKAPRLFGLAMFIMWGLFSLVHWLFAQFFDQEYSRLLIYGHFYRPLPTLACMSKKLNRLEEVKAVPRF